MPRRPSPISAARHPQSEAVEVAGLPGSAHVRTISEPIDGVIVEQLDLRVDADTDAGRALVDGAEVTRWPGALTETRYHAREVRVETDSGLILAALRTA